MTSHPTKPAPEHTPSDAVPSWRLLCTSAGDLGGPCADDTLSPWRTALELYQCDLPMEMQPFSDRSLSLIRAVLALSPSSERPGGSVQCGVILQLGISSADDDDQHRLARETQFVAVPTPFADLFTTAGAQGAPLEPLYYLSHRLAFLLPPQPSLFLDEEAGLDGLYEAHFAVLRPRGNDPVCLGITLDTASLEGKAQAATLGTGAQRVSFRLDSPAREVPGFAQYLAEVTKTLTYTAPEGWLLDKVAAPSLTVSKARFAGPPEVKVLDERTLSVTGTAGWRFWQDAPAPEDRLQDGWLHAEVEVGLKQAEADVDHIAQRLLLKRLEWCCCPPKPVAPTHGPALKLDVSRHAIRLPRRGVEFPSEGEAMRAARLLRQNLIRSISLARKGE